MSPKQLTGRKKGPVKVTVAGRVSLEVDAEIRRRAAKAGSISILFERAFRPRVKTSSAL